MQKVLSTLALLFLSTILSAQSEVLIVKEINISGNRKTKTNIILRELDVQVGDTLLASNLEHVLEQNRLLLNSTGLCAETELTPIITDDNLVINIKVEEAWYLYPYVNVSVGDRNFNIWKEKGYMINRLNYTFQGVHRNLTGRRDFLMSYIQVGYEPKFRATYELPYINKAQTLGIRGDIYYTQAKEWGLSTDNNLLTLMGNQDSVLIRRLQLTAGVRYQQGVFTRHEAELRFHHHQISDFSVKYNPDFFLDGNTMQRYFAFRYLMTIDYRDFKPYPEKGYFFSAAVNKEGLGVFGDINTLFIEPRFAYFQPLGKRFGVELNVRSKVSITRGQVPYYNSRSLGYYSDYMRGYELYVTDGLDYVMNRGTVRYKWFDKGLRINKNNPNSKRQVFPLKIYSTIFQDNAYVNNPFYGENNSFANSHLWCVGTGLDLVIYNDFVLRLEYTANHLWEHAFYMHLASPF